MTGDAKRENPSIEPILQSAVKWKRDCLLGGGSVFQPGLQLWTRENMSELVKRLPSEAATNANILDGWKGLLESTPAELKKLAAEVYWVQYLCLHKSLKIETQRRDILEIWSWSGDRLQQDDPHLTDELLYGIGGPLRTFLTSRGRELRWLVRGFSEILVLSRADRENLLSDPLGCTRKLTAIPDSAKRLSRHMLLYLLFPEERERSFSNRHRRAIAEKFSDTPLERIKKMREDELDELLFATRKRLEKERDISELDWYSTKAIADEWGWKKKSSNAIVPSRQGYVVGIRRTSKAQYVYLRAVSARDADGNPVRTESLGRRPTTRDFDTEREYLVSIPEGTPTEAVEAYRRKHGNSSDKPYFFLDSGERGIEKVNAAIGLSLVDPRHSRAPTEAAMQVAEEVDSFGKNATGQPEVAKNVILYGPPGTGKTYELNRLSKKYVSEVGEVSEQDRWEALAESLTWWKAVALVLAEKGGEADAQDLKKHPLLQIKSRSLSDKASLASAIADNAWHHSDRDKNPTPPVIFEQVRRGTWKLIDDWEDKIPDFPEPLGQGDSSLESVESVSRYAYVTFHQSYSYEDFVEGIRPVHDEEGEGVAYCVKLGVFRRICARAKSDPGRRYAMFIDEINRGNISKIFGELITLLEPDKRAHYDEDGSRTDGMELTLPYSGDSFGVPANLDVYGGMNTADRSIALLDTALRRRFEFEELMPDASIIPGSGGDGVIEDGEGGSIDLRRLLEAMNRRIRFLLDREHMVGHSYFMDVKTFGDLRRVMFRKILPLLQEYFYEDWSRIQLVLRDRIDEERNPPQIVRDERVEELQILGYDHDDYEDKVEYEKVSEEEITPEAIRKVYET